MSIYRYEDPLSSTRTRSTSASTIITPQQGLSCSIMAGKQPGVRMMKIFVVMSPLSIYHQTIISVNPFLSVSGSSAFALKFPHA